MELRKIMARYNYNYVEGNAVRELGAEPVRREQENPARKNSREEQLRRKRQLAARRNRERALYMSRGHVAFLSLCVLVSAFFAAAYVRLQADVTSKMKKVSALESQIADLKADNDARYNSVTTSIDLNEVKDAAVNRLGMRPATEDQIVFFSVDNNNFMDQYSDIPEK
jgi:cell division protein FtsL